MELKAMVEAVKMAEGPCTVVSDLGTREDSERGEDTYMLVARHRPVYLSLGTHV
jgi:hypothetical protein